MRDDIAVEILRTLKRIEESLRKSAHNSDALLNQGSVGGELKDIRVALNRLVNKN